MLVVTDYFTNFIWMSFIVDQTSATILEALMLNFHYHGCPRHLVSDGSHNMISKEIMDWCRSKKIQRIIRSPYNLESNIKA